MMRSCCLKIAAYGGALNVLAKMSQSSVSMKRDDTMRDDLVTYIGWLAWYRAEDMYDGNGIVETCRC